MGLPFLRVRCESQSTAADGPTRNRTRNAIYREQLLLPHQMSGNLPFDEPIALANGDTLRTLRDAANHIIALRARQTEQAHWQTAWRARSRPPRGRPRHDGADAMRKALGAGKPQPETCRKAAKKYRIVSQTRRRCP
jgi:hypothetical protein